MASLYSRRRFAFDQTVQLCFVRAQDVAVIVAEVDLQSWYPSHLPTAARAVDLLHFFLRLRGRL